MNKENKPDSTKEMVTNLANTTALVVSFDTTGSMSPAIAQVRQNLKTLVESMTQDIPGLKIGLIAHGDYCDGDNCINVLDLTNDLEKIMNFITNTPNTSGGDAPECYELALKTAKGLSWPEEGGSLVMIGDATPHEPNPNGLIGSPYSGYPTDIDWREEIKALREKNIKVFPLQCLYSPYDEFNNLFWKEVSSLGGTPLLMLESFGDSSNHLEALCYAAAGEKVYKNYVSKFATEVSEGKRASASKNLDENQIKLDEYVSNVPKEDV